MSPGNFDLESMTVEQGGIEHVTLTDAGYTWTNPSPTLFQKEISNALEYIKLFGR